MSFALTSLLKIAVLGGYMAQTPYQPVSDTTDFQNKCGIVLNNYAVSYTGKTTMQNDYYMYAVKYGRDWILIVRDGPDIASFIQRRGKQEPLESAPYFTEGLCDVVYQGMLNPKTKSQNLQDIQLESYYQLSKEGKVVVDGLWLLETGEKKKGKFIDAMAALASPLVNLFKGDQSALYAQIQNYQQMLTQYEIQIQELQGKMAELEAYPELLEQTKVQMEDMKAKMEALKAEVEAAKEKVDPKK